MSAPSRSCRPLSRAAARGGLATAKAAAAEKTRTENEYHPSGGDGDDERDDRRDDDGPRHVASRGQEEDAPRRESQASPLTTWLVDADVATVSTHPPVERLCVAPWLLEETIEDWVLDLDVHMAAQDRERERVIEIFQRQHPHFRKQDTICKHWLRGLCKFRDYDCPYQHVYDMRLVPVCHFYVRGECTNADCTFLHPMSADTVLCVSYARGFCKLGKKCPWQHKRLAATEVDALERHVVAAEISQREYHRRNRDILQQISSTTSQAQATPRGPVPRPRFSEHARDGDRARPRSGDRYGRAEEEDDDRRARERSRSRSPHRFPHERDDRRRTRP